MYELMLSDLDETLLVEQDVPIENVEAIKRGREKGLKFVPATGRAYNMIYNVLKQIDAYNKEDEYSICFNGALIVENKNHNILNFHGIPFEITKEIFRLGEFYDVCVMIFTVDMCYIFRADPEEVKRKRIQKAPFKVMEKYNMDALEGERIAKILFQKKDMPYLKNIEKELTLIIKCKVSISYSSNRYMEFNALGVSKGSGLKWLAQYLGMDSKEIIAIGDNYNDVEMIKAASLGVAVKSAAEDIKELAQYVTIKDYYEGAVKEVIEKFILGDITNEI